MTAQRISRGDSSFADQLTKYQVAYLESLPALIGGYVRSFAPGNFDVRWLSPDKYETVRSAAAMADFIIVGMTKVDQAVLDEAPRLRLIQHQGVGYSNLDLASIAARGVRVALSPFGADAVAEHAVLLMLAVSRNLLVADRALRGGNWYNYELRSRSYELAGKTVGIIGMGRIGQSVAKRVRAFGTRIIYYDVRSLPGEREKELQATSVSLSQLLDEADIVSLHVPLTSGTATMLGRAELQRMKASAILVNTSRGEVVDQVALADLLARGGLGGAGLDVFDKEPVGASEPLIRLDNVVLTPHIAAGTAETFAAKMELAFRNMCSVISGDPLEHELRLDLATE